MWISLDGWKEKFWFPAKRVQQWVVDNDEAGESNEADEVRISPWQVGVGDPMQRRGGCTRAIMHTQAFGSGQIHV